MEVVIAEHDKRADWLILVMGVLLSALSLLMVRERAGYWFAFALGVGLLGLGIYLVLLPKTAILRTDCEVILCYAFHKTKLQLSQIEYVSATEHGEWHARSGSLFWIAHTYKNDIRRVCITAKIDGTLKYFYLIGILDATAVTATLNSIAKQTKENGK